MKVGCVNYINALPLNLPFQLGQVQSPIEFVYDIPQALNHMMQNHQLDIALSSSVEYLDGNYQMLPGFGIVGKHEVLSVNLYTKVDPQKLQGACIGLTHHSATSISLLKVLCRHLWKVEPHFEPLNRAEPFKNYDAFLLIGDEALEQLHIPGFQTIDLAKAWSELTELPFVFALFSIRSEVSTKAISVLQKALEESLKWSAAHSDQIFAAAQKRCKVDLPLIQKYYNVLSFRLGPDEMKSLEIFRTLRKDVSKIVS